MPETVVLDSNLVCARMRRAFLESKPCIAGRSQHLRGCCRPTHSVSACCRVMCLGFLTMACDPSIATVHAGFVCLRCQACSGMQRSQGSIYPAQQLASSCSYPALLPSPGYLDLLSRNRSCGQVPTNCCGCTRMQELFTLLLYHFAQLCVMQLACGCVMSISHGWLTWVRHPDDAHQGVRLMLRYKAAVRLPYKV